MQSQSNQPQGLGGEMLSDAKGVGKSAVNRLHEEVDARKTGAVTHVQAVSSAVTQTAQNLGDDAPAWLKRSFEQGAEQVRKIADSLEQRSSKDLASDVSDFARNSPTAFLAACAAAGFAASRIFRAGASATTESYQDEPNGGDPLSGYAEGGAIGAASQSTNISREELV